MKFWVELILGSLIFAVLVAFGAGLASLMIEGLGR